MADAIKGTGGVVSFSPVYPEEVEQVQEFPKRQEYSYSTGSVRSAHDSEKVIPPEVGLGADEKVKEAVDALNKLLEVQNAEVRLSVFKDPDAIVIKLIEKETEKIIREFPSEKILKMVHSFLDMMGLIVDKKV